MELEKVADTVDVRGDTEDVNEESDGVQEKRSKNSMKKQKRWEDYEANRADYRLKEKEKRKRKRDEKNQAKLENGSHERPVKDGSLTTNEEFPFKFVERHPKIVLECIRDDVYIQRDALNELYRQLHSVGFSLRSSDFTGLSTAYPHFFTLPSTAHQQIENKQPLFNPMNPGKRSLSPTIVIDCGHEDKMIPKELYSLVKQLTYCYGAAARAVMPCKLLVTGLGSEAKENITRDQLTRYEGHDGWTWRTESRTTMQVLADDATDLSHLVYLTAESDNTLDEIDPEMTYIIGGIVDHNRLKGYAHQWATERGIKTARLPIDRYMANGQRSVLTIVNVVELLLARQTMPWNDAMRAILPKRWKWTEKDTAD